MGPPPHACTWPADCHHLISASNTGFIALRTKLGREFLFALSMHYGRGTNPHNRCDPYLGASIWPLPLSSFYPRHQHYLGLHHHNAPEFFLCTSLSNQQHLQSPCNAFPLLYTVFTLIQRLYRSDAYPYQSSTHTFLNMAATLQLYNVYIGTCGSARATAE